MALLGKATLGVWNEVDPAIEDSFNDWYVREHIPERVSVPGMLRGRRYRADVGTPRYMALYEASTLDVLTTGHYRWQLDHPTPWTSYVMPGFRVAQRGICDVLATAGDGIGGVATVIHFSAEDRFRSWLEQRVAELPGMRQVRLRSTGSRWRRRATCQPLRLWRSSGKSRGLAILLLDQPGGLSTTGCQPGPHPGPE